MMDRGESDCGAMDHGVMDRGMMDHDLQILVPSSLTCANFVSRVKLLRSKGPYRGAHHGISVFLRWLVMLVVMVLSIGHMVDTLRIL